MLPFSCVTVLYLHAKKFVLNKSSPSPLACGAHFHCLDRAGKCLQILDRKHGHDLLTQFFYRDLSSRSDMHGSTARSHAFFV